MGMQAFANTYGGIRASIIVNVNVARLMLTLRSSGRINRNHDNN